MLFFSCSNADTSWKYNYVADPVNQKNVPSSTTRKRQQPQLKFICSSLPQRKDKFIQLCKFYLKSFP